MKGMSEWVRLRESTLLRLLEIPRKRLPHQTTYERVLAGLDEDAFNAMVGAFFTVNEAIDAFEREGLGCIQEKSSVPNNPETAFDETGTNWLKQVVHQ